jgi:hypothetical protein
MADSSQTRAGRAVPLVALILAIALLVVAVGAAAVDHGRKRDSLDRALKAEVREQSQRLDNYFARARSLTQITANNPAYREFYVRPGERVEKSFPAIGSFARLRRDWPTWRSYSQGASVRPVSSTPAAERTPGRYGAVSKDSRTFHPMRRRLPSSSRPSLWSRARSTRPVPTFRPTRTSG